MFRYDVSSPKVILQQFNNKVVLDFARVDILSIATAISILWSFILVFILQASSKRDKGIRVGIAHSNLSDEYEPPKEIIKPDSSAPYVKSLWIYPVKSCQGIELEQARIVETGLQYDRQFTFAMFKTSSKHPEGYWDFMTQRSYPLLAKVRTAITMHPKSKAEGILTIAFLPKTLLPAIFRNWVILDLPLVTDESTDKGYPRAKVHIWKEYPEAIEILDARNFISSLKQFLGVSSDAQVALFRMPPAEPRKVFRNAPTAQQLGYQPLVGFADSYPIHLMNLSSNQDLNGRISKDIPQLSIKRFRANIITTGSKAYEEDFWKRIKIGASIYVAATRAVRCKLPNVDQETGEKHRSEPDRTMRSYRNIDQGAPVNACMGLQLVPEDKNTVIRVGDQLEVLETGDHCYLPL